LFSANPLLSLLLILFVLVFVCVAIHGVGMSIGLRRLGGPKSNSTLMGTFWFLVRVVYGLLLLHLLQITVWAAFYQWGGCFPDFETSFYFSATSYSTVGYGDVLLAPRWRILGSVEAVTGVLMFGWSTGVLFTVAQQVHAQVAWPVPGSRGRARKEPRP